MGLLQREQTGLSRYAHSLLPTLLAVVAQAGAFALTARALGAELFGRYSVVLAVASTLVEVVGLGASDVLVRSTVLSRAQYPRYMGHLVTSLALTLPFGVVIGWVLAAADGELGLSVRGTLALLSGELLAGRVAASSELVMLSHDNQIGASWLRLATALVRLVTAALYFCLLPAAALLEGWTTAVLLYATAITFGCAGLIRSLYGPLEYTFLRAEVPAGALFAVNQVARSLQSNLDRMALGHFATDAALGAYAAGARIIQIGLVPIQVATRMFYPRFFEHGREGIAGARRYALRCALPMLAVGAASAVVVATAGLLAPRLLGDSFSATAWCSPWLALSLPLIALQYPAADALTAGGFQGLRAKIFLAAAVGFGALLAGGALLDGVRGVVAAHVLGNALLGAVLWLTSYWCEARSRPAPASNLRSPEPVPE